jgi:hypothetical protein
VNARPLLLLLLLGCSKQAPAPLTEIGRFQVESGAIVLSDPCYDVGEVRTLGASVSARTGAWIAAVRLVDLDGWGRRSVELHARHDSLPGTEGVAWVRQKGLIGVDSGQAGVFDAKQFRSKDAVPKGHRWKDKPVVPDDPWYSLCCEQTLGEMQAGVIPFGAVSSAGVGDGAYEWDLLQAGGQAVALRIVFIPENER